jgi:hypothetical protein
MLYNVKERRRVFCKTGPPPLLSAAGDPRSQALNPLGRLKPGGAGDLFPRIRKIFQEEIFNAPPLCGGDFSLVFA